MAIVTTDNAHYTAIADAIRSKTGGMDTYTPEQMAGAVAAISGGSLVIGAENLHDSSQDIANTYLSYGVETAYSGWTTTGYIPVKAGTTYAVQAVRSYIKGEYCALYNSDKKYQKSFPGGFFSVTSGVSLFAGSDGYVRFSGQEVSIDTLAVFRCSGSLEFASDQSKVAVLSDDISDEMALDILTGGGPAE